MARFRKAADHGYTEAQFAIALVYSDGQGVPKNLTEAATWLRKSADQGFPSVEFNMGVLYVVGMVVPQDWARREYKGIAKRPSRGCRRLRTR